MSEKVARVESSLAGSAASPAAARGCLEPQLLQHQRTKGVFLFKRNNWNYWFLKLALAYGSCGICNKGEVVA